MPSEKTRKQLQQEVRELKARLAALKDTSDSAGSGSAGQSIVGMRTLTLRYDADSSRIISVNTPFANYVRMQKDELVGQQVKILASVLGTDIYKEVTNHNQKAVEPPRISDAANNVYEVLTTEHDGVVDVVMRDMTEAAQFKSYVQRYFGLDFESLSDEDKRSLSFPERRFITISFTDLRGFTKFTESNNPEEVRSAINAYFDEVIEAAEENDVFPNQIVGDEVMVLYGAPKYHRDHPLRAVKTACEHIERVTRLRAEYALHDKEIPHCGIGINSGDVIVGDMGSSVRDRKTYTALGTAVNLAARLCSAATPGQIILSEATLNAVLRVLPEGWEHNETQSKSSSNIFDPSSDKPQGKIEDVIPLPANLIGKEISIGPGVATKDEEPEFVFHYLFQIKAKGIAEALPVLTVERPKKTAMSKNALSDETEANEDGEMILGKYRLVAHIGRGGMGTVWRARDEFVNTVAIKMLNAGHGASESQVARFKREAKVMGKLAHRNICRIQEIGKAEGRIFIAMQFIDGVSLEQLISHQSMVSASAMGPSRSRHSAVSEGNDFSSIIDSVKSAEAAKATGPTGNREDGMVPGEAQDLIDKKTADIGMMVMTDQQVLTIISKVCDAVQFAHERGVLHRDLKPANIMIGRDGEPIVMDFGLAKLTRQRDDEDEEKSLSISIEGQVVGTIEYMAPEQALSSKEVNEQADVYSIGAILYHLITGQKPFKSTGHILADAKALQDHVPTAPRKLDRLIDPDLETIILKALQPDQSQRYRSVNQVRQDIDKYQSGDPISARKPTIGYRFSRKYRKHKVPFWLGFVALVAIFSFVSYYIYDYQKSKAGWNRVADVTFSEGDRGKFTYLTKEGEAAEEPWLPVEEGQGVRLLQNQWLWFTDEAIRGDAKVEVKMRYDGDPEGFQICLNGNHEDIYEDWNSNPVGYSCRLGFWRAPVAVISANQKASATDLNKTVSAPFPSGKQFTATFQRRKEHLTLFINNEEVHKETVLLPLRGDNLRDIGFRTWSDRAVIESIRIYRYALPMEASPTVAGDSLVEINENEEAIEKYLTIANDYPDERPGTLALTKALQLWNQTYLNADSSGGNIRKKDILWQKIDQAIKDPARKFDQEKKDQIIAPLKAIELISEQKYREALDLFPSIVHVDENARIAIECLQFVDRDSITTEFSNEFLPWIARTSNVAAVDLRKMKLESIDPLGWIDNLTAIDIRNNQVSSLDSIRFKPLKALYCMNNRISSLDPLEGMELQELWCGNNQISDISVVSEMTSMHTFSCLNNQVTDISPLANTPTLYTLYLSDNEISDLSALKGKQELYYLYCANNPVTDLSPLADCPNLQEIDISGTQVTSVEPLKGLENLTTLTCPEGDIEGLEFLRGKGVTVYQK